MAAFVGYRYYFVPEDVNPYPVVVVAADHAAAETLYEYLTQIMTPLGIIDSLDDVALLPEWARPEVPPDIPEEPEEGLTTPEEG